MERVSEILNVRLTPAQMAQLKSVARREGRPLSNMARRLIEHAMREVSRQTQRQERIA